MAPYMYMNAYTRIHEWNDDEALRDCQAVRKMGRGAPWGKAGGWSSIRESFQEKELCLSLFLSGAKRGSLKGVDERMKTKKGVLHRDPCSVGGKTSVSSD